MSLKHVSFEDYEFLRNAFRAEDSINSGRYGYPKFLAHCPVDKCGKPGHFGATLQDIEGDRLRLVFGCFACRHDPAANAELVRRVIAILLGREDAGSPNVATSKNTEPLSWVETYAYPAWQYGRALHTVRYATPSGKKEIRECYHGNWDGIGNGFPPLYGIEHWATLGEQVAAQTDIFLVEGEKDVHTLWRLGLWATTKAFGTGGNWKPEYTELLRYWRRVFVIPDLDQAGLNDAAQVLRALRDAGIDARDLCLPGPLGDGFDVSDWVSQGGTRDMLLGMIAAPNPRVLDRA